jgi:plasmid stabilization system protein ParE
MTAAGYDFHPEAEIDVDAIWEFIAEDSQLAADRMIKAIEATIEALVPFPHQGHRRPDLTSRPLRFTNAGNYLIAYAPDKKPLWVVAVMHGRRNPRVMAAMLRGREYAPFCRRIENVTNPNHAISETNKR